MTVVSEYPDVNLTSGKLFLHDIAVTDIQPWTRAARTYCSA